MMRYTSIRKTQQLVALAQDGDKSALDQLCKVYSERVQRIVRFRMGKELRGKLESMDLVQDAFVAAVKDLDRFEYRDEGDFLRWMSKIAENRIRDNLKRFHADKRDIRREVPMDHRESPTGDNRPRMPEPIRTTTPSVIMSISEELNKLENAMNLLKTEYREVIVLNQIEGLSLKQIGDKLGKSPDAVRMLVARAMASLAGAFEKV
ncbi:MAG: sigma-70 family RNA polymerase sigma factor [Planctomycetota bacterium]|jgi:RNA polymerase sigma-70 factor (ECF subfamily)